MGKVKVIAMYLPQFHRVQENDEWWGEGFTEWTAVKSAIPLFKGHEQPKIPQNAQYYDLMNKEVMIQQCKLMKKYNVTGLCFYHYWFGEGKKILEKPAENLLRWKDINIPFCFCWANESWVRSWKAIYGNCNTWAPKFESDMCNQKKSDGILLEQKYGDKKEWKEHFDYLITFFKDNRYIYIDNKPIFLIYKPDIIDCISEMLACWNKWAIQKGLEGIYFIGANTIQRDYLDAVYWHEPQKSWRLMNFEYMESVRFMQYDDIWNTLLNSRDEECGKTFYGGFVNYDDTPRKGSIGTVIYNDTPEKFKIYLADLYAKNAVHGNEFVFVNAWNEWGEGMYLEPDKNNRDAYLKATKEALEEYTGEAFFYNNKLNKNATAELAQKYKIYWMILDSWLVMREKNICISSYFKNLGIKKIVIYGIGMLGRHLIEALRGTEIEVMYGIDRRSKGIKVEFPVCSLEDELPEADAVIMTVVYNNDEIVKKLKEKVKMPIISLQEIILTWKY